MNRAIDITDLRILNRVGHALADSTRAQILLQLCQGEAQPSLLAEKIGVSRQVMSNQLACLRGCGLVDTRKDGRNTYYRLSRPILSKALCELLDLAQVMKPHCCTDLECECK